MKVCPSCGFKDNPMWKPWRIYWEYADQTDFVRGYPQFADLVENPPRRKKCEEGNFYYNFDDNFHYFQLTTRKSKRKLVRRFPKGYESMANRQLFEKTPSEKDHPQFGDIYQKKLVGLP